MDMDLPILDILDHQKAAQQLIVDLDVCNREDWEKDVERYAPGYLALEAAGHGSDYDLNRLVEPSEIENVKTFLKGWLLGLIRELQYSRRSRKISGTYVSYCCCV